MRGLVQSGLSKGDLDPHISITREPGGLSDMQVWGCTSEALSQTLGGRGQRPV